MIKEKKKKLKEPLLYRLLWPLIWIVIRLVFRPKIVGKENIPNDTNVILAGNHTHNFDCVLLICSTKKIIHFLAKKELFKGIYNIFYKSMGCIPVDRSIHDKKALNNAIECLNNNMSIGIFPEGTTNKTNETILPFKIGSVKMAYETNTQIVPFIITGKYRFFRKGIRLEFFKPIKVENENLEIDNNRLMNIIKTELERNK